MPAAGYKLFVTGDVLTAAQVNDYLMLQTVMVFANSAARTSALSAVLAEGLVSYLQDTNVVEIYTGAAWVSLDDPNAIQNSIVDAKGDLISATADNTPARLAVGTDGQTLVADSSTATGLKWATPSGGGKVLQVVEGSTTTTVTSTSSTYADTGLTATITPSSASSKILVFFNSNGNYRTGDNSGNELGMKLFRGATQLSVQNAGWTSSGGNMVSASMSQSYLDSPAPTSATTYKTQFANLANASLVKVQNDNARSSIILMEIGA